MTKITDGALDDLHARNERLKEELAALKEACVAESERLQQADNLITSLEAKVQTLEAQLVAIWDTVEDVATGTRLTCSTCDNHLPCCCDHRKTDDPRQL